MPNYYVICHYNDALWIGIVVSVNEEQNDCKIKFMHPNFHPDPSFGQLQMTYAIKTINPPITTTGHQYNIKSEETKL